ncbi:MAG TPA: hypothetical protein V6C58_11645 [Allocoleopsis sp.]
MLKSYEAIYENGQVKWLDAPPEISSARIIITVLEEKKPEIKRRFPVANMVGKAKILGDIVSPIVNEDDWECLK